VDPNNFDAPNLNVLLEICAWGYACFREGKVVVGCFHGVDEWTTTDCNVVSVLKDVRAWSDELDFECDIERYCFRGVFSWLVVQEAVFIKCVAMGVVLY
jgi:hypothetical protein